MRGRGTYRTLGLSPMAIKKSHKSLTCSFLSGKTGIRTLGTRKGTTVFETAPIDHSGIFPYPWDLDAAKIVITFFAVQAKSILKCWIYALITLCRVQQQMQSYSSFEKKHFLGDSKFNFSHGLRFIFFWISKIRHQTQQRQELYMVALWFGVVIRLERMGIGGLVVRQPTLQAAHLGNRPKVPPLIKCHR